MSNQQKHPELPYWTSVDNLGKLFPSYTTYRHTNLFRLSMTLDEPIIRGLLVEAAANLIKRFPYFHVTMKSGFFWWHLMQDPRIPLVVEDTTYPCMPLKKSCTAPHLFRLRYYKNRIAAEINHSLTDGNGAMVYLQALVKEYLRLKGADVSSWTNIPSPDDPVPEEEWEDAFWRYFEKLPPPTPEGSKAFRLPYPMVEWGKYYVTTGTLSVQEVKKAAKAQDCTVTEFLVGILVFAYQECMLALPEEVLQRNFYPLKIQIPVNLRTMFETKTMRNFFLTPPIEFDPRLGSYSLEEIFPKVRHFLRNEITDKRLLLQQIGRNIRGESHPLVRIMPLFIKNMVLGSIYKSGMKKVTTSFSNLGLIRLPEGMTKHVKKITFIPPPNAGFTIASGAVSYGDDLSITFGRLTRWNYLELAFFSTLRKQGLRSVIVTNQEEGENPDEELTQSEGKKNRKKERKSENQERKP
jgi:hypothetical protein